MARRIIAADAKSSDRIAFKASLASARYDVRSVSTLQTCLDALKADGADLVLIDASLLTPDGGGPCDAALIRRITGHDLNPTPVVVITDSPDPEERWRLMSAGAADVVSRPLDRTWLLTTIRSLLRGEETAAEMRRRAITAEGLGFAEESAGFTAPSRIALVAPGREPAERLGHDLAADGMVARIKATTAIDQATSDRPPDAFVISALSPDEIDAALWLVSELRSLPQARRLPIVTVHRPGDCQSAGRALDLGATDTLWADAGSDEVALRLRRQIARKVEAERIESQLDAGLKLAAKDELTGLWSRRYAMHHLSRMARQPHAEGRTLGLLIADVDHFKVINDTWGHAVGDLVLKEVAARITEHTRDADMIARIGGEELLVAMPDIAPEEAFDAAERLRLALAETPFDIGENGSVQITMSIGVCCTPGLSVEEAMRLADTALYQAKHAGRNRCHRFQACPARRHDDDRPIYHQAEDRI